MANIFRAKQLVSRTGTFSNEVTAPNLVYNTGFQNISGLKAFELRPTVNGTGVLLSGEATALPETIVYTTGNQTISGLKDFTTRPTVNTIPVLLSGENANGLSVLVKNDDAITLVKGQPVYIYSANGNNILVRAASNTGEAFSSKTLGLLSQTLDPNAQGYVTTEGNLEGVDTSLAGSVGDPIWLGPTGNLIFGLAQKPYAPNHLVYLGVVERKQANNGKIYVKIQNGFEIDELHNVNINHSYSLSNEDILRYNSASGLWFNQPLNTGIFQTQINNLSGAAVLKYSNQNIDGTKYFRDSVYINNLYVTGAETILNTINNNISSPYLLLNLTGGLNDGGIFFVTGVGLTGINDTGIIFGFDNITKTWHFGEGTRLTDISTLDEVMGMHDLTGYSGLANQTFATISNLNSSGINLTNTINSLSGSLNSTGINLINWSNSLSGSLNTSGINLIDRITSLSGLAVLKTGSQIISGDKTFVNNLEVQGTGIFTNIDLSNISSFSFSGVTIDLINSVINSSGQILISGNPVLTGIPDSAWATQNELDFTGLALINRISSLSGSLNTSGINISATIASLSGNLTSNYATITNVGLTGIALTNTINSLSGLAVLTTGDQTISGNKSFISKVEVISPVSGMYGTGDLLNALNVRGFASVSADLSSLTGIFNIGAVGLSGVSPGQFSAGNMLIGQNEGGAYIGRVGIRENSWQVLSGTEGVTWTARMTNSNRRWLDVAMSSDGRIQAATVDGGQIYNSYDYGVTWTARESNRSWRGIAMSSDGRIQTAIDYGGGIYISYDYGVTWVRRDGGSDDWTSVAMSSDGRVQLVTDTEFYIISFNYGRTWSTRIVDINKVAMSSDGRVLFAIGGGLLYTSYDYGVTWTARESSRSWHSIAMSSDGRIMTATVSSGQIYTSYDYGVTWTARLTDSPRSWRGIAMSSDGRIQIATVFTGYIYTSYDYGVTWTARLTDSNRRWWGIAMSSDGRVITATVNSITTNGYLYTSYATTVTPNPINILGSINAYNGSEPQSLRIFNATGVNSGEFGTFSWTGNNLIIGAQQSQSGMLRDVIITGRNINISASDALNIFDPVNITGNVNVAGNIFISGNPVLTGIPDGSWASQNELDSTGLALVNRIDSLSGSLNSSGISISNTIASLSGTLNSSGVSISNTIASLSGNVVFLTGNQNISGTKTFLNNIEVSGTGIFNAIDFNNIDNISLSGIDISITGSTVNVYGNILISGNPVLTGIPDSSWATQNELDSTGLALVNRISSLSGSLNTSGINLITNINNLSGYVNSLNSNIVFTTGNQTINGLKTFTSGIDVYSGNNPQSLRIFNSTGTNSGEFGLVGWQNNNLIIGSQQSQSGILRNVIITGNNININPSGNLNLFNTLNISGYNGPLSSIPRTINIRAGDGGAGNLNPFRDINLTAGNSSSFNEIGGSINMVCGTGQSIAGLNFGGVNMIAGPSISISSGTHNIYGNLNINNFGNIGGNTLGPRTINIYRTGLGPPFFVNGSIVGLSIDQNNANFQNGMGLQVSGVQVTPANYVNTTSNQTINGLKVFSTGVDIYNSLSPQSLRVFNITGVNSGEFGLFGWINNSLIVGPQKSEGGTLRNLTLTGNNININAFGAFNIFDPTNISGNLNTTGNILLSGYNILNYISLLSGSLNSSGVNLINWTNSLSGSLNDTGIALINRIASLSGSLNISGIDLFQRINSLSGAAVLIYGDQNVGGNKTFTGITTFSGQEVNIIDTALNLSGLGDMTFSSTNINFINSPVLISGTNLRVSGDIYGYNIFVSGNPVLTGIPDGNWASQSEINSLSGNVVLLTGDQTIVGTKTFSNTGVFNTLSIQNSKLTSYAYHTNNFTFNNYINIVNSSSLITGTLQDPVQSGINYYVKNLNTGILLITGASNRLIDGYSFVNLYKNESLNIMGVNNIGYTGWVTLSLGGGVS